MVAPTSTGRSIQMLDAIRLQLHYHDDSGDHDGGDHDSGDYNSVDDKRLSSSTAG